MQTGALERAIRIQQIAILYISIEAMIALVAAMAAGSVALMGFGLDSVIEVTSAGVVLWRLQRNTARAESLALRVVGACFLVLAVYVAWEGVEALWRHEAPHGSALGMVLAAASLVAMPLLARVKRKAAGSVGSGAMAADARQSDLCAWLSAILLAGLALNALFGWWWTDPAAALAMAPVIAREGVGAWRGKTCACGD